jgi:hypothetical protein
MGRPAALGPVRAPSRLPVPPKNTSKSTTLDNRSSGSPAADRAFSRSSLSKNPGCPAIADPLIPNRRSGPIRLQNNRFFEAWGRPNSCDILIRFKLATSKDLIRLSQAVLIVFSIALSLKVRCPSWPWVVRDVGRQAKASRPNCAPCAARNLAGWQARRPPKGSASTTPPDLRRCVSQFTHHGNFLCQPPW